MIQSALTAGEELPADRPRVEGEVDYPRRRFTFPTTAPAATDGAVTVDIAAFCSLPPVDALSLLEGEDNTGQMVWDGAMHTSLWICARWPALLGAAPDAAEPVAPDVVLELGCGAGLVGLAAAKLCQPRHMLLETDGSEECVELTQRNVEANALPCPAASLPFLWTDALPSAALAAFEHAASQEAPRLLVVAGDVIYGDEAVPLLLAGLATIAAEWRARCGAAALLELVLGFMPRAWDTKSDTANIGRLCDGLGEAGWAMLSCDLNPGSEAREKGCVLHFAHRSSVSN